MIRLEVLALIVFGYCILLSSCGRVKDIHPMPREVWNGSASFRQPVKSMKFYFVSKEFDLQQSEIKEKVRPFKEEGQRFLKRHNYTEFQHPNSGDDNNQIGIDYTITVELMQDMRHPLEVVDMKDVSEEYELVIDESGQTYIKIKSYFSFLRALDTMRQVLFIDSNILIFEDLPIQIKDFPEFYWRGIMIDTSRHFLPKTAILQIVDGLRISKLNILHIHFTDSDSFPLEVKSYPDITIEGAYSPEEIYTAKDVTEMIEYGQLNGVFIIPEVDSPAHTRSWSNPASLNAIDACRDYPRANWSQYCYQPPCGQLDPTLNKTIEVVGGIMKDLQEMFKIKYLHLGGDEISANCWNYKPSIKQFMNEHNISNYSELQSYYRLQQNKFIEYNRTRIYWYNGDAAKIYTEPSDILQYWDSSSQYKSLQNITNYIILSTYDILYFDCGTGSMMGGNSWCDPYKTWLSVYQFDPYEPPVEHSRIIGAVAPVWSELVDINNIFQKIWPRTFSLSERLWNVEQHSTVRDLSRRLMKAKQTLQALGIPSDPISSQYCEFNEEDCFFATTVQ